MIINIDEIKNATNILDVVKRHVELKRTGTSWVGLCPFHHEKTPSFHVHPQKQIFKCFGCGESGDAIEFLMLKEGLTFPEAVKAVAEIGRVPVQYDRHKGGAEAVERMKKEEALKSELFKLNAQVLSLLQENCDFGDEYEIVFAERQYHKESIQAFFLTVAPDDNLLTSHFEGSPSFSHLKNLGLISENRHGPYDFFRARWLFPIHDHRGRIAGFAGRATRPEQKAKYINSPASLIYQKDRLLYGLYQARPHIVREGRDGVAFLVEGYTDVLTMWEHGFRNVVATCGTSLSLHQARLLKRYAQEVIVLRDADQAGIEAAKRDVLVLVEAGLVPKVLILPPDKDTGEVHDPDSFLRKHGAEAFRALMESDLGLQDGILWRIEAELGDDPKDIYNQEAAFQVAVRILSFLDSFRRDKYTRIFVKPKYLGCTKRELEERVLEQQISREKGSKKKLDQAQERDLMRYGIFIGRDDPKLGPKYFKRVDEALIPLSNFIIEPIYHIASQSSPARLVRIRNEYGHTSILDLHTDFFEDFLKFKKAVAAKGNFKFKGACRQTDFASITAKLYDEMETVYRISTLGHHAMGFWTWANGVTMPDGKFVPCNDDGTITIDNVTYLVPGYDVQERENRLTDDSPNTDQHIGLFSYHEGLCPDFRTWVQMFVQVHGTNGVVAAAYYLASLYRDLIYPRFSFFPHLNGFGPKGKGKSTLGWSLSAMFGKPRRAMSLNNFTTPGFAARMEQTRNAIVWLDEYKNHIENWKVERLKEAYDGTGRERRDIHGGTSKSTESTPILNALYISGQDLPTKDIALLSRCITLSFSGYDTSPEGLRAFKTLRQIEQSGVLSQITSRLQAFRKIIDQEFDRTFDEMKALITQSLTWTKDSRIIENHTIPVAVVKILSDHLDFPEVDGKAFWLRCLEIMYDLINQQVENIESEDETSDFWRRLYTLSTRGDARHDVHFIVQNAYKVKVLKPGTRTETREVVWDEERKLIFVHLDSVHVLYERDCRQAGRNSLSINALKTYLEQHPAWVGKVRSKRFDGGEKVLSCYCFRMDRLPIDLPLTTLVLDDQNLKP